MIDQEFVKYVTSALVNKPEAVEVERTVDERGVLLTLKVDSEDLGRVIGRKGSTAQSLRTLLRALGSKNEAHYNLRILDGNENSSPRPSTKLSEDNDFAKDTPLTEDMSSTEESEDSEPSNSLDETKKELEDLSNDLN